MLKAGYLTCGRCKSASYPVSAEWVSDQFVLASYEQAHEQWCPKRKVACGAVLIDVTTDSTSVPDVPRPRLCKGTVRAGDRRGKPCKSPAGRGSAYCAQHDPARQAAG